MFIRTLSVAAVAVLAGCQTYSEENMLVTPPTICQGEDQCDMWWSRAQAWLGTASLGRIVPVSSTYLKTYGSGLGIEPQYMLMRESRGDGEERLRLNVYCPDIMFGCTPAPDVAYRDFYLYVTGEIENQAVVLDY